MNNGKNVLRAISDYFSHQGNSELNTIIVIFVIILIGIIIWSIIQKFNTNKKKKRKDIFEEIPQQDMELLKQISAQKGISCFDRDYLLTLAIDYNIKPVKILLDIDTFEKIEKILQEKSKNTNNPNDSTLKNLRVLKSKLF